MRKICAMAVCVLITGCVTPDQPAPTAGSAAVGNVSIYCHPYDPNPGSLKGEVRLYNATPTRITAKVARGNNAPQEHVVSSGRHATLGYLGWTDLPCNHSYRIVSWE